MDEVDKAGLARAIPSPPLELAIAPRQRPRVAKRGVGAPAVDAEAQREVLQLAAVARQRANERQRVVEHEAVHAVSSGREPAQYGNVEVLAVVRDEDVVADEGSKL